MSLVFERKKGIVTVKCSICNKVLAEINEDTGDGWGISECNHYKWERISTVCFYDSDTKPDICDPAYITELRKKSILKIDDGGYFLLLVRRND